MIEDQDFYKNYLDRLNSLFEILEKTDMNARFSSIESLLDKKLSTLEASQITRRLLEVWQGLLRDLYLSELGLNNLLQYQLIDDKIKSLEHKYQLKNILNSLEKVDSADDFFDLNINPRLILENISLSI